MQQRHRKNDGSNEDTFFVMHAEKLVSSGKFHINLPNRSIAYRFAQEVVCDDQEVEPMIPLGLHASWNYRSREWMTRVLRYTLPT